MTPGIYITGTGTGVGKTLVAATWARALGQRGHKVVALKPVASGARRGANGRLTNDDALELQAASSLALPYELTNPYCFEPAIAPHLAAEEASRPIELDALVEWYGRASAGAGLALVEGAGGWRVPSHPLGFLSDLPERLGLGVVLVVGLTLGCLSHARLTLEAIERSGRCPFVGWIGNCIDPRFERLEANLRTLDRLLGRPALALVPSAGPQPDPARLVEHLSGPRIHQAVERLLETA